jgi:hypothetical protein
MVAPSTSIILRRRKVAKVHDVSRDSRPSHRVQQETRPSPKEIRHLRPEVEQSGSRQNLDFTSELSALPLFHALADDGCAKAQNLTGTSNP